MHNFKWMKSYWLAIYKMLFLFNISEMAFKCFVYQKRTHKKWHFYRVLVCYTCIFCELNDYNLTRYQKEQHEIYEVHEHAAYSSLWACLCQLKTEKQRAIYQKLGHYRLILRISFVRVPSRGFAKVPEQTIQNTEKHRRVWVGSGDIAECCSLMSKCHAEARQISCRSPNRSTHRQNGIYNNFFYLF